MGAIDEKYVFFGAGKIGKKSLECFELMGLRPICFVDNKAVGEINGIPIIHLGDLPKEEKLFICLTSTAVCEMREQLLDNGFDLHKILDFSSVPKVLSFICEKYWECSAIKIKNIKKKRMLVDLQNGITLGGVENWAKGMLPIWNRLGWDTQIALPHNKVRDNVLNFPDENILYLSDNGTMKETIGIIRQEEIRAAVCNFCGTNFQAVCMAKLVFHTPIRLIAVCHNDEEAYYTSYSLLASLIDKILVISEKMKREFINRGVREEKIETLRWRIKCQDSINHKYSLSSEPIRLGYAGRITKLQKRMDLMIRIIEALEKKQVPYIFSFVGQGDFDEELREFVKQRGLSQKVVFKGMVDRCEIAEFWANQDVMVSCSDWEGHSITQCEAMAQGAIPIITDVSGARDDIHDGVNGFIVPVGDWEGIADCIEHLAAHRELLSPMGHCAHDTMLEKNATIDEKDFWKHLLEE